MRKFWAVVKREYVQRVRSRMFILVTLGAPLMFALFTVVPILIAGIRAGGPTRIAVLDETGTMFERVRDSVAAGRDSSDDDAGKEQDGAAAAGGAMNQNTSERMEQVAKAAAQSYAFERVETAGGSPEELRARLDERVRRDELDA